ncbi:MAG: cytidylate kinase [Holophagaceae bacterium]|nr:cytidylate kinase [Holophagaceae bacterium]
MSRTFSSLPPSVEQRLSGWVMIQERLAHHVEPKLRPTITISRQFGCEGFPLAERLKVLMEEVSGESWNIYDKTLLEKVAEDEGISMNLLRKMGDIVRRLELLGLNSGNYVTQDAAFEKVAKHILQIAKVGNALIVGRGGAILCHELTNSFHFRMEASFEWRVQSLMERLDLPQDEVEKTVKTRSKLRDKFISQCLNANVGDLQHYDAVFNNERHSVEAIAQAILAYVREAWEDKSYFRH